MTKKFQKLITFEYAYETQNKVRFNETVKKGEDPLIGALYVGKKYFDTLPKEGDKIQIQLTEVMSSTTSKEKKE